MITSILLLTLLLGFPALIIRMERRSRFVRWISPIILCYLTGILLGNIPGLSLNKELLTVTQYAAVLLAIPLLLFSSDFKRMLQQVRPALFAFFLGIVAVISCSLLAFWIFRGRVLEPGAVSGMMVGVYTGGTPNMNAIGLALGVEEEVYIILNSADILFSGIYFAFLLTIGKRILGLFLPSFRQEWNQQGTEAAEPPETGNPGTIKPVVQGLLLALATLAAAAGISWLVTGDWNVDRAVPIVILGITTLGIGASFNGKIRHLPHTFSTATYLLLVFAVAMGSLSDFSELLSSSSNLFLFCGMVVMGSVLLHFLLAYIFRIERDTLIIASTAAIFGPAFIGPVANAIGNREIITIGIALGLIGYAVGNYLGLGLSFILR